MVPIPDPASQKGHIFLSHAGADTRPARGLAEVLRRSDIPVWFDKDSIPPGADWMAILEKAISNASAMIVYIGASGIQAWVEREVRFGLVRNTLHRDSFRFIPVLGDGADPAMLPPFVQQHQCVDLRDPAQLQRLIQLLRGESPSQPAIPAQYWTTHSPFRSLSNLRRRGLLALFRPRPRHRRVG
jgi:hypothetical protein